MRFPLQIALAAAMAATATTAHAQMRFQELDTNRDGVITRAEWRGNDVSFRNQDWNGDGILSGDEVRTGARRQANWNQDWNKDGRIDNLDTQISQRFRGYDMDNDNRVGRSEWPGDARLFTRLDTSRDGYLSMDEYIQGGGFNLDAQGGPSYRFSNIDVNNDGWVTRSEWKMSGADFSRLDLNRDNRISRFEFENDTAAYNDYTYTPGQFNTFDANRDGWVTRPEARMSSIEFDRFDVNRDNRISRSEFDNIATPSDTSSSYDRFATVDANHDGWLVRSEWRGTEAGFTRLDRNRDNRLSRTEYDAEVTTESSHSAAWRSGYERGTQEGRAAGREDYTRRQGWDLDGQRELERADSGYSPQAGTLSEYQAGYREGFRAAYRAGFTEAGGRAPR